MSDYGKVAVIAPGPELLISVDRTQDGIRDIHLHPGGQGFWVARMAARLEADVDLVGTFGDEAGIALQALIASEGIAVRPTRIASSNAILISDDHEGEPATLAERPSPKLNRHEMDALYNAALSAGSKAQLTVLTGTIEAVVPPSFYRRLAHDLRALGCRVAADLSGAMLEAALDGGLDVVKVSDEELFDLRGSGQTSPSRSACLKAARDLALRGPRLVVLTRAQQLLLVIADGQEVEIEPPPFEPLNHRGAGDSLTGALAAGLAEQRDAIAAVGRAVSAGALNVTRHGLGTGDRDAIEQLAAAVRVRKL